MKTETFPNGRSLPVFTHRHSHALFLTIAILAVLNAAPALLAQGQSGKSTGGGAPGAGSGELFSIDFAEAALGAPPKEILVQRGKLEVVEKDGAHMLRAASDGVFLVLLPKKIPNKFAIEFDIVPKFSGGTNSTELSFEGTRDLSESGESAHVRWNNNQVVVIGGGLDYMSSRVVFPEDLKEEVIGNLTNVRVEFDGNSMKLFTNGQQIYDGKQAKFVRGRVLRVGLGGQDDGDNAVYLARLHITGGTGGAGATTQQPSGNGTQTGTTGSTNGPTHEGTTMGPSTGSIGEGTTVGPADEGTTMGTSTGTTEGTARPEITTGGTTAPASITGLVAQANEFGGAWANWDPVPGAVSYFTVCWNTADPHGPKFTSSPEHVSNGTQIGVLTTAGTYGFRVYAKTATGVVTGETQVQFGGATNQQPGTTVSSTPSTGSTTADAAATAVTGIAVTIFNGDRAFVSWDPIEDALNYFAICWDTESTRSFQVTTPPDFLSSGWEVGVLPAPGNYAFRVFAGLQSGGYVAGEIVYAYGGATNQQAGTTTGGTQPPSTGSSDEGVTGATGAVAPATDTGVVLRVNSDGGAIGTWDPVPDASSYFAVLWNATNQNTAPWVTSSQDFNNARMLPGSGSTGWQIGILPSPGTYVLRVYATTASGVVATGEAQVDFAGTSNQQAGTIIAAAPTMDTGVVLQINGDGGAIGTWDPVPDASSYFAVLWNATNQNTAPWVTSSQDFNNARMLPGSSSTDWQIGILPSPGTYVLRVYATSASGVVATGEAQGNFAGLSDQQAGTTGTTPPQDTGTSGAAAPASVTGIMVGSIDNANVSITWDPVPGATSYVVSRWNVFDPDCCNWTSVPVPTNATMAVSMPPVTGAYGFRVVATTANGDVVGETRIQFAGAAATGTSGGAAPASVTGIVVAFTGDGAAWVSWDPVPGATSYVVSRSNLGDPNCCNWTSAPVTTSETLQAGILTVAGIYNFRVTANTANGLIYGDSVYTFGGAFNQQAGTTATGPTGGAVQEPAPQPGQTVQSGSYKVTIAGLSVYSPTNDDPSVVDGVGDEVFVCAVLVAWERGGAGERSYSSIKSVDYGDVADGRYAGRVRAGHASQTGGIGRQDVVPDGVDPTASPSGTPQPEHLPLVMWQGTLTAGREILVLSPSVWEHDGTRNVMDSYIELWNSSSRPDLMESLPVAASLADPNIGAAEAVFFPEILNGAPATSFVTPPWTGYKLARATFNPGVDRPIGFEVMPGQPDVLRYGERFVVITQEKLASLQVGQGMTVPVNFVESSEPNIGGGNYRLHVRIERTQ